MSEYSIEDKDLVEEGEVRRSSGGRGGHKWALSA